MKCFLFCLEAEERARREAAEKAALEKEKALREQQEMLARAVQAAQKQQQAASLRANSTTESHNKKKKAKHKESGKENEENQNPHHVPPHQEQGSLATGHGASQSQGQCASRSAARGRCDNQRGEHDGSQPTQTLLQSAEPMHNGSGSFCSGGGVSQGKASRLRAADQMSPQPAKSGSGNVKPESVISSPRSEKGRRGRPAGQATPPSQPQSQPQTRDASSSSLLKPHSEAQPVSVQHQPQHHHSPRTIRSPQQQQPLHQQNGRALNSNASTNKHNAHSGHKGLSQYSPSGVTVRLENQLGVLLQSHHQVSSQPPQQPQLNNKKGKKSTPPAQPAAVSTPVQQHRNHPQQQQQQQQQHHKPAENTVPHHLMNGESTPEPLTTNKNHVIERRTARSQPQTPKDVRAKQEERSPRATEQVGASPPCKIHSKTKKALIEFQ